MGFNISGGHSLLNHTTCREIHRYIMMLLKKFGCKLGSTSSAGVELD